MNNLTKIVVTIWLFVVLILTLRYTASLSSMLTVKQLHPAAPNLQEIVLALPGQILCVAIIKHWHVKGQKLYNCWRACWDPDKGSSGGGIGVAIAEIPYLKVFLSEYCGEYTMVGNLYKSDGFGFVSISYSLSIYSN